MIEKVTVSNVYNRQLDLELRHPEKSGYAVTSITGIEPMDVDIKTTQFVSGKKFRYNAGFHKLRAINITIIFYEYNNYHKSIETLRTDLYKYFLTNGEVTLTFLKDNQYYSIKGVVDKNAPTIFSQQTGATISIICPELWFYLSDASGVATSSTYTGSGSLTYNGDFETGFITELINTNNVINNVDVHIDTKIGDVVFGAVKISPKNLETNQTLYVSTKDFGLDVYTIDNGTYTNRINFLDASAMSDRTPLPILREADNVIDIYKKEGEIKTQLDYTIRYNTLYRGL